MEKIILHIDVNNAFLSWSALDLLENGYKYDIRNSYAVIGGDETKRRGVVLAKSNSAKKLGIVTGEALFQARKKCSALRIYPPNFLWYQKKSQELFKLLSKYTNDIEVFSIDECFFDYGKVKHLYGDEISFAYRIKEEIFKNLGFSVNIGIANSKLCSKMASDFEKPNKVHTLYDSEITLKMHPLPVEELFGIGKKTAPKLKKLGIKTIGDLASFNSSELYKYFKNQSSKMIQSAKGIDESEVIFQKEENKGISNSTTLEHDVTNKLEAYECLKSLSENIGLSLRKQKKYCSVVAVNLKNNYFKSSSHQVKLKNSTNITNEIYETAKKLFDELWTLEPIRLIGLRVDQLSVNSNHQVSLFDSIDIRENDMSLEKTVDNLKDKYGFNIINNADNNKVQISKKYLK